MLNYENGIPCVLFGRGDILIVPIKGEGLHGVTLYSMDKPMPVNVPLWPLPAGTTDEDVCMCGHKMLVRLVGQKPGDLDALIAVLQDIREEVGGGAEYVSTVNSLRARVEKLEQELADAIEVNTAVYMLGVESGKRDAAMLYEGRVEKLERVREAAAILARNWNYQTPLSTKTIVELNAALAECEEVGRG